MDELRRLAEQRVRHHRVDMTKMSADEIARMVAELEIHQEELEIQNEELYRAQLELKSSRDRYVDLYDFAPVGYLTLNTKGEITEANLTVCEMLGRTRSQLLGARLALFCDPADRAELSAHYDEAFGTGKLQSIELQFGSDTTFYARLESRCSPGKQDGDTHCRTVATDITASRQAERLSAEIIERQRLEDRLRELEKRLMHFARVNTMGEMVAGIAHEINQPLHAIANFAAACELTLMQRARDEDEQIREMVRQIAKESLRSGEIIRRLRSFGRTADTNRSTIDMHEVIEESVKLTASEARRHKVEVRIVVDDILPPLFVDRIQIEQVLVNLIRNAFESMAFDDREGPVTVRACRSGEVIHVSVEDTGTGLAPQIADSIFDAFATTKDDGMGLGLAISRSIIEAHGGRIWATPNKTQGTIIHFTLPAGK